MANQSTCRHVDSLRMSLESLTHMQMNASSAAKIRTDLTNMQTQLAALKGKGGGTAFSSQINQLSALVDKVKRAASGMSNPPTTPQVTAVVTALTGLKAQSRSALAAMNAKCPMH